MKARTNRKSGMNIGILLLVVSSGVWWSSCDSVQPVAANGLQFQVSEGNKSEESFRRRSAVIRNGRQEDAMVLVAPLTVRALLAQKPGLYTLSMRAAQVFNIGDGLRMEVSAGSEERKRILIDRLFDAGRKATDRSWVDLSIPVELRGTRDEYLEIRVSGGSQGDLVADWLALAGIVLEPDKR